jgi:hypothetical protein
VEIAQLRFSSLGYYVKQFQGKMAIDADSPSLVHITASFA